MEGLAKALRERGHEVVMIIKIAKFDDRQYGLNAIRVNSILKFQ